MTGQRHTTDALDFDLYAAARLAFVDMPDARLYVRTDEGHVIGYSWRWATAGNQRVEIRAEIPGRAGVFVAVLSRHEVVEFGEQRVLERARHLRRFVSGGGTHPYVGAVEWRPS